MKYIVLVGDGMADYPIKELGGKTPLEAAETPNMDFIAQNGQMGEVRTIPDTMSPGSDVANFSILGYDPLKYYTGRGPLEATNLDIELKEGEVAFRCNLVTVENEVLLDYSAGHITTKEAEILIRFLDEKLGSGLGSGSDSIRFYSGTSYRHIMVISDIDALKIKCVPPHDITGKRIKKYLPKGKGAEILIELMDKSRRLLVGHEVNQVRIDLKENPANMIWLWGQGSIPQLPSFQERFGIKGSVISAVDLLKGIGKTIGLEVINVPGATGYYDTDYSAKAKYGLKSLKERDFLFLHVEAPDEAGHNADLREKILAIERFDRLVVGAFLKHFKHRRLKDYRILVLPDHATPIVKRTHTQDPVCFAILGKGVEAGGFSKFSEAEAKQSKLKFDEGYELMEYFIRGTW